LRIISGIYKGRNFTAPANLPVRPTTDFAKTGLFNILQSRYKFSECYCLDLFSGIGSIGLELISRGSFQVVSVDRDAGCINFQKELNKKLQIANWQIIKADVLMYLKNVTQKFDIIFADPPFDSGIHTAIHEMTIANNFLKPGGMLILEHISGENYDHLSGFDFVRSYGNVSFSFFANFDSQNNISKN
jgi:16S rRNA (guanine(966)-N(2))-methyltransferase RsmD